jgi:molecular chaperone GrpE
MTDQTVRPDTPEADASADDALPADAGGATDAQDLQQELEQVRAQYARALADYQNLERRSREDRAEVGRAALAGVVVGLLPVLDDLQRAIEAADNANDARDDHPEASVDEASWLEGVRLVAQKFAQTLQQLGMEEIHALGQPFDPNRHEAVGGAPGPDGQVVHLLRRGYLLKGQVVRPAMVMVGNGEADGRAGSSAPASTDSSSAG